MKYEISKEESRTIYILKAMFIILVVFIHTRAYTGKGYVDYGGGGLELDTPTWLWNLEYFISSVIAHTAVPGFFLMSGTLLYRKDFDAFKNIKRKFISICIPWFIVITLWVIFYYIVQRIPVIAPYFSNEDNVVANWGIYDFINVYLGLDRSPLVYPLWYLQNLMFLNIIAYPLKCLMDKIPKTVLCILLVVYFLPFQHILFCLEKVGLFWFCIGYYVVRYGVRIKHLMKISFPLLTILYVVAMLVVFFTRDSEWVYIPDGFNIALGLLWFARVGYEIASVGRGRGLETLGIYSFFVYIMHEMTLRIMLKVWTKFLGNAVILQVAEYFILPMMIVFGFLAVGMFLDKHMHPVYQVLNGGR